MPEPVPDTITCIKCEYPLHTIDPNGVCPECGRAVVDSWRPHLLACADLKWLRRVLLGSRIVLVAPIVFIGIFLAMMVVILIAALFGAEPDMTDNSSPLNIVFNTLTWLAVACAIVGTWLVTSRQPNLPTASRSSPAPTLARITSLATAALFLAATLIDQSPPVRKVIWGVESMLLVAWVVCLLLSASAIMRWWPDATFVRRARKTSLWIVLALPFAFAELHFRVASLVDNQSATGLSWREPVAIILGIMPLVLYCCVFASLTQFWTFSRALARFKRDLTSAPPIDV